MKNSKLGYSYSIEHIEEDEGKEWFLTPSLKINGVEMLDKSTLSFKALVSSMYADGEFFIFTCGCGTPNCAGIYDGVVVLHWNDFTKWLVPEPISLKGLPPPSKAQRNLVSYREFYFSRRRYISTIRNGIRQAQSMIEEKGGFPKVEVGPHGFSSFDMIKIKF